MAETPPSVLKDKLRRYKEINEFLETEFQELCEFTMYEKQLLSVEKGCTDLGEKNTLLQKEVDNLTKIIESRDDAIINIKKKFEKKKAQFSQLKSASKLDNAERSLEMTEDGGPAPVQNPAIALVNVAASIFDDLSQYLSGQFAPDDGILNQPRTSIGSIEVTGELVQNEVKKLRQILENTEEKNRRFSDSFLAAGRSRVPRSFGVQEVAVRTAAEEFAPLISFDSTHAEHLLDMTNKSICSVSEDSKQKPEGDGLFLRRVHDLEKELYEMNLKFQALTSANEDLEKLILFKDGELQEYRDSQNGVCSGQQFSANAVSDVTEVSLGGSDEINDSHRSNFSFVNHSYMPTIPEAKESSFDGSFDENNVPDFSCQFGTSMLSKIDSVSERSLLEMNNDNDSSRQKWQSEITELQKCQELYAGELEHCFSEIDAKNEQITLLHQALPMPHFSPGISQPTDLLKLSAEQIESLERLFNESEEQINDDFISGTTEKVAYTLNIIQRAIDSIFSQPKSSDYQMDQSSFANVTEKTLQNASYAQQLCSVEMDASMNVSSNNSTTTYPLVQDAPKDRILDDVRNLRLFTGQTASDFTCLAFNAVNKLVRLETILLRLRNFDFDHKADSSTCSVSQRTPKEPSLVLYEKNVFKDILEKASDLLNFDSGEIHKFLDFESDAVSQNSDQTLCRGDQFASRTNSVIYSNADDDSSQYTSAADEFDTDKRFRPAADENCVGSMSSGKMHNHSVLTSFWNTLCVFRTKLQQLGISASNLVEYSDENLTLERVTSVADQLKEDLNKAASYKGSISSRSDHDSYDPDCTQLLSIDVSLINEEPKHKKTVLQTSLSMNQNADYDDDKENSSKTELDGALTVGKAIKNWKKFIHDSNNRISELVQAKTHAEMTLSQKLAENRNLTEMLEKMRLQLDNDLQIRDDEKSRLIIDLKEKLADKECTLDAISNDVHVIQEEANGLGLDLVNSKATWNQLLSGFAKKFQDYSTEVDSLRTEVGTLREEKEQLFNELSDSNQRIKDLQDVISDNKMLNDELENQKIALKEQILKISAAEGSMIDMKSTLDSIKINWKQLIMNSCHKLAELETLHRQTAMKCLIETAGKKKVESDLSNYSNKLSSCERKIIELEEAMIEKSNQLRDFEESGITVNEQLAHIVELKNANLTCVTALQEARQNWAELIKSSSEQIDRLNMSNVMSHVQQNVESAQKTHVMNELYSIMNKLSAAEEKIVNLELNLQTTNKALLERNQQVHELEETHIYDRNQVFEANKVEQEKLCARIQELACNNLSLKSALEQARMNWSKLIKCSCATVDQLKVANRSVDFEKSAEKTKMEYYLLGVKNELSFTKEKISNLELDLCSAKEALLDKSNQIRLLEESSTEMRNHILSLEAKSMNVNEQSSRIEELQGINLSLSTELEHTRRNWNNLIMNSSETIDQLKTSNIKLNIEMSKEFSLRGLLEKEVRDVNDELIDAERKISVLHDEIGALKKMLLEKDFKIQDLLANEAERSEQVECTRDLENVVVTLTSAFELTRLNLNKLVTVSSETIAQLRLDGMGDVLSMTSKQNTLEDELLSVTDNLSDAERKISDLEFSLQTKNEDLLAKISQINKLKAIEVSQNEQLSRVAGLERVILALTLDLDGAREIMVKLIKCSKEQVNRAAFASKSVDELRSAESAEKAKLAEQLDEVTNKFVDAEHAIRTHEVTLNELNEALNKKSNQVVQLESKVESLSNKMKTLIFDCSQSFREHDLHLGRVKLELTMKSLEKDNIFNSLEEMKHTIINMTEEFNAAVVEKEALLNEKASFDMNKECALIELRSQLEVANAHWNDLILDANRRIDEIDTAKRKVEMQITLEVEERNKVSMKLESALAEIVTLRGTVHTNEELIEDMNCNLVNISNQLSSKTQALDEMKIAYDTASLDLQNAKSNWETLMMKAKEEIEAVTDSEKSLSTDLTKERASKAALTSQLAKALSTIGELEAEIENLREPSRSTSNEVASTNENPVTESRKCNILQDESVVSVGSLGNEDVCDDYEITSYNATVHLERSVFISDLVMERTLCGDNVDPLSMSIVPGQVVTPRKTYADNGSSDESETEFGTPVATHLGHSSENLVPRSIFSSATKTPTNIANQSHSLEHFDVKRILEENEVLQENVRLSEENLASVKAELESSRFEREQATLRIVELGELVDIAFKTLNNRLPDLPIDQKVVNMTEDIVNLISTIGTATGTKQTCLVDSVKLLITKWSSATSAINNKMGITLSLIKDLATDYSDLKREILCSSELMSNDISETSGVVGSCIKSIYEQVKSQDVIIEDLNQEKTTLQRTLLTTSLEKESLRDERDCAMNENNSLKVSYEEKIGSLETQISALREKNDVNIFQRNYVESCIMELLRQWNGDEMVMPKDLAQELKTVFNEAIQTKTLIKEHLNKPSKLNLFDEVKGLLSNYGALVESFDFRKTTQYNNCKDLSLNVKNVKNESNKLMANFVAFKEEIQTTIEGVFSALEALSHQVRLEHNLKESVSTLEVKLKESYDRISNYESALEERTSTCDSLTEKVKLLDDVNTTLSSANVALSRDADDSKMVNKELVDKVDELRASNNTLSSEIARLQETVVALTDRLSSNDNQLPVGTKEIESQCDNICSFCVQKDSFLDSIKESLDDLITSTDGKPIDLTSTCESKDILAVLTHSKDVLFRSNDALHSVLVLLNLQRSSGVLALESIYTQLKSNDIRDVYSCKVKFSEEIQGLDQELKVEDLMSLPLIVLHSKFLSVIMQKERKVIQDIQKEYENELASKDHQLNQFADREKYMKEMIEEMTKENEKLEESYKLLKAQIAKDKAEANEESCNSTRCREMSLDHMKKTAINEEEKKLLTVEVELLKSQIVSLKSAANEPATKFEVFIRDLDMVFKKFSSWLNLGHDSAKYSMNDFVLELPSSRIPNQLSELLSEITHRIGEVRRTINQLNGKSNEDDIVIADLKTCIKEMEKDYKVCRESESSLEMKVSDVNKIIESKDECISSLNAKNASLEVQVMELERKKSVKLSSCDIAVSNAEHVSLASELECSRKHVQLLKTRLADISNSNLGAAVKDIAKQLVSIKDQFLNLRSLTATNHGQIGERFKEMGRRIELILEDERRKSDAQEVEESKLREQIDTLNAVNVKLLSDKQELEECLAKESNEKRTLCEKLKLLEQNPVRTGHDDKTCPYKDKVQESKKELWLVRQQFDEEMKKFEIMKKNIEEDLAFKSTTIKQLEERNETNVNQFQQRLASYNHIGKKLEEREETIAFLREMHSEDKKKLEKEICNLTKEISRFQSVKMFIDGLGLDCDTLQEALPDIKNKLTEYEAMTKELDSLKERNVELDEECEFMNKQITFLESRNAEMFKASMESAENIEQLKKELSENIGSIEKCKSLQEELNSKMLAEAKLMDELALYKSELEVAAGTLAAEEMKSAQLKNAYKQLEVNLESRNQKILHYVSEIKNYESMLTEKTKMIQEVGLALEDERSKFEVLSIQKSSLEKDLKDLHNELGTCHSRLKELSAQLEAAANFESNLALVVGERDEALRACKELERQLPATQKLLRDKETQLKTLTATYEKLVIDKRESEDFLKAREREVTTKLERLEEELSDKAVRIAQFESLLATSNSDVIQDYKTKISSLEKEVEKLKNELSTNAAHLNSAWPQHVTVEATSSSSKNMDSKTRQEFEKTIHYLEKKQIVLKRLCQSRRDTILTYEDLLKQHNIQVPSASREKSL